jgi:Ig-fold domain
VLTPEKLAYDSGYELMLMTNVCCQVSPSEVTFQLRSRAVAACVALETPLAGRFNDNAVLVLPWEPLAVTFIAAAGKVAAAELQQSLSIMSMHHAASAV